MMFYLDVVCVTHQTSMLFCDLNISVSGRASVKINKLGLKKFPLGEKEKGHHGGDSVARTGLHDVHLTPQGQNFCYEF